MFLFLGLVSGLKGGFKAIRTSRGNGEGEKGYVRGEERRGEEEDVVW